LARKEARDIICPFCGAPYKKFVPSDALQLKCDYCGATFHVPPKIGVEIPQCSNHPERFASGICNDCGRSFCKECLHAFPIATQGERAVLYLCPSCLRKRNLDKANAQLLFGSLLLIIGLFIFGSILTFATPAWLLGVPMVALGVISISYALSQRSRVNEGPEGETDSVEKQTASVVTEEADAEAEQIYDQLFAEYVGHWGLQTGTQLLDDEIRAYTWQGESFADAVRKISQREKRRTSR
jgi:uncharacterized Zn-finger protein